MTNTKKVLVEKLKSLHHKRSARSRRRDELTAEMATVENELWRLEIEVNLVESLLSEIPDGEPPEPDDSAAGKPGEGKMGATDAVLWYLEQHPEGATPNEIVTAMADRVDTTSPDSKRLLYNTILNLKSRRSIKLIQHDGEKRYVVNVNGHAAE